MQMPLVITIHIYVDSRTLYYFKNVYVATATWLRFTTQMMLRSVCKEFSVKSRKTLGGWVRHYCSFWMGREFHQTTHPADPRAPGR